MTLRFGTAGVRAPLGDGPDRMNPGTVALVVTAVARHLRETAPAGATVVVAGDARHGSARFVAVACAVLAAHDLVVVTPGHPVPTPVLAAAVRSRGAVVGLMVTASHNPPGDNGVKVYGPGGAQIVPPTDTEVERHLAAAEREGVTVPDVETAGAVRGVTVDPGMVDDYVAAVAAGIGPLPAGTRAPRVTLTPVHGVGGEVCRRVLAAIGVDDVEVVADQAEPDPDFPTVASPNPERPETVERLLALAERIDADVALALDPDADRCATGTRGPDGRWRMLDGDDTGALLADHLLRAPLPGSAVPAPGADAGTGSGAGTTSPAAPVVASTIVSSRLPSLLVPARGGRHVETLTGFKWLVRAGDPLRYAYEEAIGHCVLPGVVADKDGISAAAAWCAMVVTAGEGARPSALGGVVDARLAALRAEFGAHLRRNVPLPLAEGTDPAVALRRSAERLAAGGRPTSAAGTGSVTVTPLVGTAGFRVDVDGARAVVRPSGTEPLLKTYVEAWTAPEPSDRDVRDAEGRLDALAAAVAGAVAAATGSA